MSDGPKKTRSEARRRVDAWMADPKHKAAKGSAKDRETIDDPRPDDGTPRFPEADE